MATFRTKQFVATSFIFNDIAENESTDLIQLNAVVDSFVLAFATDNNLFNERLFRNGCGKNINQDCIITNTNVKTNDVPQRMYNGRFI